MATMSFKVSRYKDRWQVRGRYPNGQQFRRTGKTQAEVTQKANRLLVAAETQGLLGAGRMTVSGWLDQWLDQCDEHLRPTTAANYRYTVDHMIRPYIGSVLLTELDETHLRDMWNQLKERGYGSNTLHGIQRRLRKCLNDAVSERKIHRNPAQNVRTPKGGSPKERNTWTFEQIRVFTSRVAAERDAALWLVWVTTGLRRGEIAGLRWENTDLDAGLAHVVEQRTLTCTSHIVEGDVKTMGSHRKVALAPPAVNALREWRATQSAQRLAAGADWKGGDCVFTTADNKPYHPASFGQRLTTLTDRYGLPRLTPHELRHTWATLALESDKANIKVISEALGHSKVGLTMDLYVHPNSDQIKAAGDAIAEQMFG